MKKYIIKKLKIFVILMIIISFVLPSYASISASDGSVFVTKGEFENAIADYQARLTVFEAGINSKIDSQVTSFLDKNGIWTPKEQKTNNIVFTFSDLNSKTKTWLTECMKNRKVEYQFTEQCIIENVDKTGLCYMESQWDKSWSCNYVDYSSIHCAFEGAGRGTITFGIYKHNITTGRDEWEPYATKPGIITLVGTNYSNIAYYTTAAEMSKVVSQFFVGKNDKLIAKLVVTWGGRTQGAVSGVACNNAGTTVNNIQTSSTSTTPIQLIFKAKIF